MRFLRFCWLSLFLAPWYALHASPLPELPAGRIAISESAGNFGAVDAAFQTYSSKAGAQYWAAVLKNCDGVEPSQVALNLYEKWNARLDPGRHVLFVVCRAEGALVAHVGTNFSFLGTDGAMLAEKLMKNSDITTYLKSLTEQSIYVSLSASDAILSEVVRSRAEVRLQASGLLSQAVGAVDKARQELKNASEKAGLTRGAVGFEEAVIDARIAEARLWLEASPTQAQKIAQELIDKAKVASAFAQEVVTQSSSVIAKERELADEVKKLQNELPITAGEDQAATDALKAAERVLAEIDAAKKLGDYTQTKNALAQTEALLGIAKEALREGNIIKRQRTIYTPLLLFFAFALAALIAGIGFKRYAEAWSERALGSLDVYGSRIADLAGRLDSLRAKYPQLVVGHELHDKLWNETLKRYESAGEKYDRVTALIAKARQLIIKAKETSRLSNPFAVAPSRGALRILQEGNCEVQYGPELSQAPVMLKTKRTHITKISSLLDEIALSLPAAAREMEDLHHLFEEAGPAAKQAKASVEKAQELYKELSSLGVVPTSAQVELSSLNAAAAALGSDLEHDPSVVVKRARLIQESSQLMASRLNGALSHARRACEELPSQVRALWVRVYELRQNGFKLREATFEPEALKERLDQSLSGALTALSALDLDKAQKELSNAEEALLGLREGIKSSMHSKEHGPKEDTALRARIEAFQERLNQEKPAIERTLARIDKAAAKDITEQIDRAPFKVGRIAQLLSEAERRAQESLYLAAAERRNQAAQQLKSLEDLLNDIRDQDKLEAMVEAPRRSGSFAKLPSDASSGMRSVVTPPKPGSTDPNSAARLATPTKLPTISDSISKQVPALRASVTGLPVVKSLASDPAAKAVAKPPKPSSSSPEWKSPPEAAALPNPENKLQVPSLMDSALRLATESAARNEVPAPPAPANPSTKKLAPLAPSKPPTPVVKDKKE